MNMYEFVLLKTKQEGGKFLDLLARENLSLSRGLFSWPLSYVDGERIYSCCRTFLSFSFAILALIK